MVPVSNLRSLGAAIEFDGINDKIVLPDSAFDLTGDMSVSVWVKANDISLQQSILCKAEASSYCLEINANLWTFFAHDGVSYKEVVSDSNAVAGEWTMLTTIVSGQNLSLYVNGTKQAVEDTLVGRISTNNESLMIGANPPAASFFNGIVDELAVWSRALDPAEVRQLYRRVGNRITYKVKSCVDSACNCKSFNTSPVGTSTDCDGDGELNVTDNFDAYRASFVGPGGDATTVYSEQYNRDVSGMTFSCNSISATPADICLNNKISFTNNARISPPSFNFTDMASSAPLVQNRYFQYKVSMQAEDNTACSGEPCVPELTSLTIGPTGRFYSGSPVITPTESVSYANIEALQFTEVGSCPITYQLPPDGTDYYYWNGTSWAPANATVLESTSASDVSANVSGFNSISNPTKSLFWKAFITTSPAQSCEVDEIAVTATN